MDRIIYFRLKKNRNNRSSYHVQVFCTTAGGKELFYLQICGSPRETELKCLQEELCKAVQRLISHQRRREEPRISYLLYEESFEKWLISIEKEAEWRSLWKLPMYTEYQNIENLKWMFQSIPGDLYPKNALVLGTGMGMQDWLPILAPRVQSMTFYLEFMTGGFENFREQLYEEYGLITQVNLVAAGELQKQKIRSEEPLLVIDFSGQKPLSVLGLKRGSVWLDMDCVEAKRHSIEDRRTGTKYLSFKSLIQREMQETLDTIGKF